MSGSMVMWMGGGGGVVTPLTLNNVSYDAFGGTATVWIVFYTDGDVKSYRTGNVVQQDTSWYRPDPTPGIGASFWVRATQTSGTVSSGTVGTWLPLTSSQSWTVIRSTAGSKSCTLLIEIATDSAGTNVVTSDSLTLQATVEL